MSLINTIMDSSTPVVPEVGMGATILMHSDRHAATIVEVPNPTTVVIQADKSKRVDGNGMSESQTYEFTPNPEAGKSTYTRRKNGRWVLKGQEMRSGQSIGIGYRSEFYDYSF